MIDTSKINGEVAAFIIFLIFVIPLLLFTTTYVDSKKSVDKETPVQELKACGLVVEFEEGTGEPEVKNILENCNTNRNWTVKYNVDYMGDRYYVKVDKDKRMN